MPTSSRLKLDTALVNKDQLIGYLAAGARPESEWGIGAEMEKLVLDVETGEAAEFARIEELLKRLAETGDWRPITEGGHLVGLQGPHSSVTLEPGGQLELSGKLCHDLFCNCSDFSRHVSNSVRICKELGLALLGLGAQPFTPLDQIDWMPKARYDIMGPYMSQQGDMGQRMMKQSAGLQVNLDFIDEADCMSKLRLSQALAPLLYALFANSPILEGRPSGWLSTRGEIWSRTDPDRTGLLPFLFKDDAGFGDYVDYALDVPMYFIQRDDAYIKLTDQRFTFRQFMTAGYQAYTPTLADWDLHLSTLFPEVRLRPQIEVRSADSLPPHLALSVAALLKGLLYDDQAMAAAWELCRPASYEALQRDCRNAWTLGLKAPWRDATLQQLARHCLSLSKAGLERQQAKRSLVRSESCFLDGLEEIIDSGQTLAEDLLQQWRGERQQKLQTLIDHCGFGISS
ncbi:MAG: glutamate-cysteine ligase family protein, partial [Desulfuromonadales bacterium]|nr:glutamate-cysteine ligase family protein [Desulfuromonadales bacterium]